MSGAYPSLVELPDGLVYCVYYEEGKGSGIRGVRLRVDKMGVRVLTVEDALRMAPAAASRGWMASAGSSSALRMMTLPLAPSIRIEKLVVRTSFVSDVGGHGQSQISASGPPLPLLPVPNENKPAHVGRSRQLRPHPDIVLRQLRFVKRRAIDTEKFKLPKQATCG